jgi:outer membrane protein
MRNQSLRWPRPAGALVALLTVAGLVSIAGTARAEKPLGVIDSQRILEEYAAAKDAQGQVRDFIRDKEKEISERERELQRLFEEIESQKMLLGEDALMAKLEEAERKRTEYLRFREDVEAQVDQEYTEKMKPIYDQMKTIADRIGKEEGFGIIIDSSAFTVLYVDPDVDLTNRVLEALARGDDD